MTRAPHPALGYWKDRVDMLERALRRSHRKVMHLERKLHRAERVGLDDDALVLRSETLRYAIWDGSIGAAETIQDILTSETPFDIASEEDSADLIIVHSVGQALTPIERIAPNSAVALFNGRVIIAPEGHYVPVEPTENDHHNQNQQEER